jgi:RsiW-degrading membrane proteinase PrsW (M82 family)
VEYIRVTRFGPVYCRVHERGGCGVAVAAAVVKRTLESVAPHRWTAVLISAACAVPAAVFVLNLILNRTWWTLVFVLLFGCLSMGFALRAANLRLEAESGRGRDR